MAPERRDVLAVTAHHQIGHDTGPAGLMCRAETKAGFGVEILVKQHQVLPVGVVLKRAVPRKCRNMSMGIAPEQAGQARGDEISDLFQRHLTIGLARHRHLVAVAKEAMEFLQRLDQRSALLRF